MLMDKDTLQSILDRLSETDILKPTVIWMQPKKSVGILQPNIMMLITNIMLIFLKAENVSKSASIILSLKKLRSICKTA